MLCQEELRAGNAAAASASQSCPANVQPSCTASEQDERNHVSRRQAALSELLPPPNTDHPRCGSRHDQWVGDALALAVPQLPVAAPAPGVHAPLGVQRQRVPPAAGHRHDAPVLRDRGQRRREPADASKSAWGPHYMQSSISAAGTKSKLSSVIAPQGWPVS